MPDTPEIAPEQFLRVIGDPHRWQLIQALAGGDHRVGELVDRVGCRQNLVSYHLRELRDAGLLTSRRSSADGRDTYYLLDLDRFGQLLSSVGSSLHPGLRLEQPPAPTALTGRRSRVLFLCTGNSSRSQIAEALLRDRSGGTVDARSAGSHPKHVHPNAVRVMAGQGIDISNASTKHLRRFVNSRFDRVITLCDRVREICPGFPGNPGPVHWSIADPALDGYDAFERTANELDTRIRYLLAQLNETKEEHHGRSDRQRSLSRR